MLCFKAAEFFTLEAHSWKSSRSLDTLCSTERIATWNCERKTYNGLKDIKSVRNFFKERLLWSQSLKFGAKYFCALNAFYILASLNIIARLMTMIMKKHVRSTDNVYLNSVRNLHNPFRFCVTRISFELAEIREAHAERHILKLEGFS